MLLPRFPSENTLPDCLRLSKTQSSHTKRPRYKMLVKAPALIHKCFGGYIRGPLILNLFWYLANPFIHSCYRTVYTNQISCNSFFLNLLDFFKNDSFLKVPFFFVAAYSIPVFSCKI